MFGIAFVAVFPPSLVIEEVRFDSPVTSKLTVPIWFMLFTRPLSAVVNCGIFAAACVMVFLPSRAMAFAIFAIPCESKLMNEMLFRLLDKPCIATAADRSPEALIPAILFSPVAILVKSCAFTALFSPVIEEANFCIPSAS